MVDDTELARQLLDVIPTAMRAIRCELRKSAGCDLTIPQIRILIQLARHTATNRQMAEWQSVSAPAMTRMVDGLVQRGLVERLREGADRREVQLRLTPEGRSRLDAAMGAAQMRFAGRIATLQPADKAVLGKGLAVLEQMFA